MATINHINRFIDCMSTDPTRVSLHSIAMLDEYLMATDGHILYAQQVPIGSIPNGRIEKYMFTKKSEIKLTKTQVKVDGTRVKYTPDRPFTQQVVVDAITQTNECATIIDPKGLLKLIKKYAVTTTVNPDNGRKRNSKTVVMYIDITSGVLMTNGDNVYDRVIHNESIKPFIELPNNDSTNPISFDYFAFNPQYIMRILKALGDDCDNITLRFNRDNACGAYIFHDAGETNKQELSQFYMLMPIRQ